VSATQETSGAIAPDAASPTVEVASPSQTPHPPSSIHDPATPYGQLGMAFKRTMVAVRKLRGRETHRPGQISYAQYGLLFGLAGDCRHSARELADMANLTPATVTQMLESMETAGLVTRTRSEMDRRVVLSELTPKGAGVVRERQAQMEPRWRAALDEFDADELITAARVLNRLGDYFDEMIEDGSKD
jgi:DNA-binding MarR family transcriptional regulator